MMFWKDIKNGLDHDNCGPNEIYCSSPPDPLYAPIPLDSPITYLGLAIAGVVVWKKLTKK